MNHKTFFSLKHFVKTSILRGMSTKKKKDKTSDLCGGGVQPREMLNSWSWNTYIIQILL